MSLEKINIFPTFIYKKVAKNHEQIKDHLVKHVYPHFYKHGPNGKSQTIYTDYLPGNTALINWSYIYNLYLPDVTDILKEIGFNLDHNWKINFKGWYNITTHNEEMWIHNHLGGPYTISWSFVHYLDLDDSMSNGTIFLNPLAKEIRATCPTKNLNGLPEFYTIDNFQPHVNEGDILFFPSWLDHTAPVHVSNKLRATIAVNLNVVLHDGKGAY